jgi:hypothetical protein
MKFPKTFRADLLPDTDKSMGSIPGLITPDIPDEPDVLDAEDVVERLGGGDWRRVRRVRRIV